MCGIAGAILNEKNDTNYQMIDALNKMCFYLKKRGPDAKGNWVSDDSKIYLGHTRLSILDIDSRSNQPYISKCGNFVIIFNGEIYNYKDLKLKLIDRGYSFNTNSDTEVLIYMYIEYREDMLNHLRGMFAFAVYNRIDNNVFLARDPYGIKPLYYSKINNGIIFSSQVKSLLYSGLISKSKNYLSVIYFRMFGSVLGPTSWFKNIFELPPGCYLYLNGNNSNIEPKFYWDINNIWLNQGSTINFNYLELQNDVRTLLLESVNYHVCSDVPIGIFLSGGIDSGALAGLVSECVKDKIIGITIYYDEYEGTNNNEVPYAKIIADLYGLKHHVRKVTKKEFFLDYPKIIKAMDQPSIDGINTWYASKAASECGLKVVLSGIGGDELFFGYDSFKKIPLLIKVTKLFSVFPLGDKFIFFMFLYIYKITKNSRWLIAKKWSKTIEGAWCLYRSISAPQDNNQFYKKDTNNRAIFKNFSPTNFVSEFVGKLSDNEVIAIAQMESQIYLRNQLLRDSDWSSMDHGIELRTPFVDAHLLNKISCYFNEMYRYKNKVLLANSPAIPLPDSITKKTKTGFNIPVRRWLNEINDSKYLNNVQYNEGIIKLYNQSIDNL